MPFCSNCGKETGSNFCAQCGAAVGGAATAAAPVSMASLQTNVAAALCYLLGLVTGIVFLVLAPYNQNSTIRFHAFQSIFVNIAWFAVWIVIGILESAMPFGIHFMVALLSGLVSLIGFLGWLFLMWKAYRGEKIVLPVVGPLAEQQAGRN
jgi:uncharacterized membrane protein